MITWKEFKDQVEKQGVIDDTKIAWIDISGWDGVCNVSIDQEDNYVEIS